jgi:hypothetical protein
MQRWLRISAEGHGPVIVAGHLVIATTSPERASVDHGSQR